MQLTLALYFNKMKKTILITGSSKGIGLALAEIFLNQGYQVIGTCREGKQDNLAHPDFSVYKLDLADLQSVQACVEALSLQNQKIDMLINSAAIGSDLNTDFPDERSFTDTFAVNVMGTTFFTEQMLPLLKPAAKIINISSKMGSIGLCTGSDAVAYRMSKAALNMYSKILCNRLEGQHLVATLHPGWVQTTIAASNVHAPLTPAASASRIYEFSISNFRSGIFWNVQTQSECEW